ncbi:hypothetical protein SteCoe_28615 [Stentor coeruleus]|uniref:Niemann-Pick C1 N-terminal domain-containing protein n=1 Tax=Stentor coeruleus TaxID=5963 RepID=A0A1R2B7W7_9CILI|nr:hypothetical protein SteCoe_28615 [Stentor coeruleus]
MVTISYAKSSSLPNLLSFLLIFTPSLVSSLCSFSSNCTMPPYICNPPYKLEPSTIPFKANWSSTPACPMFAGEDVCCNNDQNLQMLYKFSLLDSTFGSQVGGCDICAANLKRLWCYFTCSPNQADFVSAGPQAIVPSPIDGHMMQIFLNNFTVTKSLSCELYNSCQKCPYVTEVSAMQSPEGFLEFQGYEGIPIGLLWTTFLFDNGPSSLNLDFLSCSENVTNAYGYNVKPCSCNNCEYLCAGDYYVAEPATLHGVDWEIIGFFYLGLIVVSVVVLFVQWKIARKKKKEHEQMVLIR